VPVFSDYGIEYSDNLAPVKARPSAKLSYTTDEGLLFVKGQNVKNAGYEAIYPVADKIVQSQHFKGRSFSLGDERIWMMNQRRMGTGNAPTWRWAAMDHHLMMIGHQLSPETGIVPTLGADNEMLDQGDLLSLLNPK
jgi:T4 beta protein